MTPLCTFIFLTNALLNACSEAIDDEQSRLDRWIASLDADSLAYYRTNQPWRLQTSADNIIRSDKLIANLKRDTPYGVYFSGSFTNNAVLQREPHIAAIYGGSNAANTEITLSMMDEITQKSMDFSVTTMSDGNWKMLLPQTYPNGGNFTFNVSCPQCFNATSKVHTFDIIYNVTFGDVYYCSGALWPQITSYKLLSKFPFFSNNILSISLNPWYLINLCLKSPNIGSTLRSLSVSCSEFRKIVNSQSCFLVLDLRATT